MLSSTSTCLHCGTINQVAEQSCVGCGALLPFNSPFAQPSHPHDQPQEWEPVVAPNTLIPGITAFGIGDTIAATLKLFTQNLWIITKIVFFIVMPLEIFKATTLTNIVEPWQASTIHYLLGGIANVFIAPALVYALMKVLQTGETPGVHESVRWGLTKLGKLTIAAAVAWFLKALGYMLCIIPGIIVGLTFAVVGPVAILENGSIEETLSRSNQLTRGCKLEIFVAMIVVGFLSLLITFPLMILIEAANSGPVSVVAGIFIAIAEQAMTVLSLVMYLSLSRSGKQGLSFPSSTN